MAFRFKAGDASVEAGLQRIAAGQIDGAIASIDTHDPPEAIHDLRKRCKKLRGLIRLVRPSFPAYAKENAFLRKTAGLVGGLRDAKVMQDTYDSLMQLYGKQVDRRRLSSVRRRFTLERKQMKHAGDAREALAKCRKRFVEVRKRCHDWTLEADGWDALAGGLALTYGRARSSALEAQQQGDGERYHDLRKRGKYHLFHCRLLRPIWPDEMALRAGMAAEIGTLLGQHHDLSVFSWHLGRQPEKFGTAEDVEVMLALAGQRSRDLEHSVQNLAPMLLAETPEALTERFGNLWQAWQARSGFGG